MTRENSTYIMNAAIKQGTNKKGKTKYTYGRVMPGPPHSSSCSRKSSTNQPSIVCGHGVNSNNLLDVKLLINYNDKNM